MRAVDRSGLGDVRLHRPPRCGALRARIQNCTDRPQSPRLSSRESRLIVAQAGGECSTVVLHRKNPAVREMPVSEGLLRRPKWLAEREGLCANYFPYPNLQALSLRCDAAGTNTGTMGGTFAKRKSPSAPVLTGADLAANGTLPCKPPGSAAAGRRRRRPAPLVHAAAGTPAPPCRAACPPGAGAARPARLLAC